MKQFSKAAMTMGLLAFLALTGLAQTQAPNQSAEALLKQLAAEVQQLRRELAQQAIAVQQWKIQQLERELLPIQNERQRLAEQEQVIHQAVAELEKQAGNAAPTPEEAAKELEAAKAAYTDKELKDLSTKQQAAAERETELMGQLKQAQQRLQELLKQTK
jgi:chromosome segregation ATPase